MVDYVLKYRTSNLIIIYHYVYSRLLGTIRDVVWNSMELMKNARYGSLVDG